MNEQSSNPGVAAIAHQMAMAQLGVRAQQVAGIGVDAMARAWQQNRAQGDHVDTAEYISANALVLANAVRALALGAGCSYEAALQSVLVAARQALVDNVGLRAPPEGFW